MLINICRHKILPRLYLSPPAVLVPSPTVDGQAVQVEGKERECLGSNFVSTASREQESHHLQRSSHIGGDHHHYRRRHLHPLPRFIGIPE